jgi:hypothetical protein
MSGMIDGPAFSGHRRLAEWACKIIRRQKAAILDTLVGAYAEAGRFDEAVKTTEELRALAGRPMSAIRWTRRASGWSCIRPETRIVMGRENATLEPTSA